MILASLGHLSTFLGGSCGQVSPGSRFSKDVGSSLRAHPEGSLLASFVDGSPREKATAVNFVYLLCKVCTARDCTIYTGDWPRGVCVHATGLATPGAFRKGAHPLYGPFSRPWPLLIRTVSAAFATETDLEMLRHADVAEPLLSVADGVNVWTTRCTICY